MLRNGADLTLQMAGNQGVELLNHLCAPATSLSQAVANCQVHLAKGEVYIDYAKVRACLACKPGYWVAEMDSATRLILNCQPIPNCQITNDDRNTWMNACQTCNSGFAWDYDDKKKLIRFEKCVPTPDVSCSVFGLSSESCKMCHAGFSLDGNGKCQSVLQDSDCLEFGASVFSLDGSDPTSFLRDGSFVKYFLKTSQNLFGCAKCKSGLNLFTGSGKICIKNPVIRGRMLPNCELHSITESGDSECFSCKQGFVILNDNSGCIPFMEIDRNCKRAIRLSANTFGCYECNAGYLPNSKFQCSQESNLCAEVVTDDPEKGTFCKYCNAGFKLVNGGCDPISPSDPCVQYNEHKDCIQCRQAGTIPHHFINQYHQKLIKCVNYTNPDESDDPQQGQSQFFIRFNHTEMRLELEPAVCPEGFYQAPLQRNDSQDFLQCVRYPSTPNCLEYNEGAFCQKCEKFHGPDRNGNCVKDAILGCEDYESADKCLICKKGHFAFGGGATCSKYTVSNCEKLDQNHNRCLQCKSGFWKNLDGGCSGYSVEFCQEVSVEADKCLRCRASHFLTAKGLCQQLTFKRNCQTYFENRDECSECLAGFYLSALNVCVPNPSGVPNCAHYQSENVCTACKPHFYIFMNSCQPVSNPVLHCIRYSDNGFCSACDSGFFLKNVFTCETVVEQSCREWIDAFNCSSCHDRMILVYEQGFSRCRTNSLTRCAEPVFDFTSDRIICTKCVAGYFVNSESSCTRSSAIVKNCEVYSADGHCGSCQKGFILTSDGSRCIAGIEEAGLFCERAEYSASPECRICDYGFFLTSSGTCSPCSVPGCAICELDSPSQQSCKLCRSGYFMNSEFKCVSKQPQSPGSPNCYLLFEFRFILMFNMLLFISIWKR